MVSGGLRRISKRSTDRKPNAMFTAIEDQLHAVLVDNTEESVDPESERYVSHRLSPQSATARRVLLARMPDDIRALAKTKDSASSLIDYTELDLIDFLLHYKNNRVLSILGTVGVGKTTFVRHVLHTLRTKCLSLRRFVPLILNVLKTGNPDPADADLIYLLVGSIRTALSDSGLADSAKPSIHEALAKVDLLRGQALTTSHFIDVVARFRDALPAGMEPVVVFDNVDHLTPSSVVRVAELARGVHLSTNACVVTTLRPSVHRTQAESDHTKGAFLQFSLTVPPPDLRAVISARMRRAFSDFVAFRTTSERGFGLEISDISSSVNSMCEKMLHPRAQKEFLTRLCNNDVRQALKAFEFFCRFRQLNYELLFLVKYDEDDPPAELQGKWSDHFLDGLMIGDYEHFVDGGGSPISSLYAFEWGGRVDYLLLYYALALLEWSGGYVQKADLLRWLKAFSFEEEISSAALRHLLSRRLIYSPDAENDYLRTRSLKISESGIYHLERLLANPQYLLNAIYDVPLQHTRWREGVDSFSAKIESIRELVEACHVAEMSAIDKFCRRDRDWHLLGALRHSGILTRRIVTAASDLIERSRYSGVESARAAASEHAPFIEQVVRDAVKAEAIISEGLLSRKFVSEGPDATEVITHHVDGSELRLTVPQTIAKAEKNVVTVEVVSDGFSETDAAVMHWRAVGEGRLDTFAELYPTEDPRTFRGDFTVPEVNTVEAFPASRITVFSASNPVIVANMPGVTLETLS